jgi:predicted nucleic acid-binding protein
VKQNIIIDTGPLVALINNREQYHSWATKEVANLAYPFFTCEAVISEACFILRDFYGGEDAVMSLLDTGLIQISFRLSN